MRKEAMLYYDVVIIGGGPAGLAASLELRKQKVQNILLIEREPFLGGVLRQCVHTGFGLEYFGENYTGPEFASKLIALFHSQKIDRCLNTTAIDMRGNCVVALSKQRGLIKIKTKAVLLTTGCRERTREAVEVAGSRPAGVFSAGQAQYLINLQRRRIGNKAIIQGSGDIGLIMARRLMLEGYEVVKVFEKLPYLSGLPRNKVQCLDYFNIPIEFNAQIVEIKGRSRVEGVVVSSGLFYPCDTVLFAVGLIPEIELAKKAGAARVNNKYETNVESLFIAGNSLHIHDLADNAAKEGEEAARSIAQYLFFPEQFQREKNAALPYKEKPKSKKYTSQFFENLEKKGQKICIVCPNSCILSPGKYTCQRGEAYFKEPTLKIDKALVNATRVE